MEINLVAEGVKFMVLGMGTVFLFLIVMVVTLQLQAKIINRFFAEKSTPNKPGSGSPSGGADENVVPVIMAAIKAFKNKKTK